MSPEEGPLQRESGLPTITIQGLLLLNFGSVKFQKLILALSENTQKIRGWNSLKSQVDLGEQIVAFFGVFQGTLKGEATLKRYFHWKVCLSCWVDPV